MPFETSAIPVAQTGELTDVPVPLAIKMPLGVSDVAPVPPPATVIVGRSAEAIVLKLGAPIDPLGAAKIVFAACEASAPVKVPVEVTGELLTVNIEGRDRPTLVTVPVAGATQLGFAEAPPDAKT